jgi:hypothetical protein
MVKYVQSMGKGNWQKVPQRGTSKLEDVKREKRVRGCGV